MHLSLSRVLALAAVIVIAAAGLLLVGSGFMTLVPALLMALPLVCGRYVGERHLGKLRGKMARRRLQPNAPADLADLPELGLLFRGGRLIAASLANRPPPLFA